MTGTPVNAQSRVDLPAVKARMLAHRDELVADAAASKEQRQPVELDQARVGRLSRMDALQGQAMALETERRRDVELKRIDAALARIEDGSYGDCLGCGEEIAHERLTSDPTTPLCIGCARAAR